MEKPVCGTYMLLEWLKDELYKHLQNSMSDTEKKIQLDGICPAVLPEDLIKRCF